MEPPSLDCWKRIGIGGDKSCPELAGHVHCRNCPVFAAIGRGLFDREPPAGYVREWTDLIAHPKETGTRYVRSIQVFRIGSEWFGLTTGVFVEVVDPRPIRPVPHRAQGILLGLISVRGEIHPCFSMTRLLGLDPAPDAVTSARTPPRLGIIRQGGAWAFPADEIAGMYRHTDAELQPVPATAAQAVPALTRALLQVNDRLVGLLDDDLLFHVLERNLT